MGQINEVMKDEKYAKICRNDLLCALQEGDSESVRSWIKVMSKKFRSLRERWEALRVAIGHVESWGRYRAMMELAIKQIEIAQDIKTKSDSLGKESFVTVNAMLAESYLSLAR